MKNENQPSVDKTKLPERVKIQIKTYGRFLDYLDSVRKNSEEQKFYRDVINADYSKGIHGLVAQKNENAIAAYTLFSGNVAKLLEITDQFSYKDNKDRLTHRQTDTVEQDNDSKIKIKSDYRAVRFDSRQAAHDLIEELAKRAQEQIKIAEGTVEDRVEEYKPAQTTFEEVDLSAVEYPTKEEIDQSKASILGDSSDDEKVSKNESQYEEIDDETVNDLVDEHKGKKEHEPFREGVPHEGEGYGVTQEGVPHLASHEAVKENESLIRVKKEKEEGGPEDKPKKLSDLSDVPVSDELLEALNNARDRYFKALTMRGRIANRGIGKLFGRYLEDEDGKKMVFGGTEGKINLERLEREYTDAANNAFRDRLGHLLDVMPEGTSREVAFQRSRDLMVTHQRQEQDEINKRIKEGEFKTGWLDKKAHKWNTFWRSSKGNIGRMLGGGIVGGIAGTLAVMSAKIGLKRAAIVGGGILTGGLVNGLAGAYGTYKLTEAALERRGPTGMTQRGWVDENADYKPEDVASLEEDIVFQEAARLRGMQIVKNTAIDDAFVSGVFGKAREKRRALVNALMEREWQLRAQRAVDEVMNNGFIERPSDEGERTRLQHLLTQQTLKELRDRERRVAHETDNERNARIKRKAAAAAAGLSVGWLTAGFLPGVPGAPDDTDVPGPEPDSGDTTEPPIDPIPPIQPAEPIEVEIVRWRDFDGVVGEDQADTFIEASGDLQDQISDLPPNQRAPFEELLKLDREELAQKLGGYRPDQPNESLLIHPGDKLQLIDGKIQILRPSGDIDVLYDSATDTYQPNTLDDNVFQDTLSPREYYARYRTVANDLSDTYVDPDGELMIREVENLPKNWNLASIEGVNEQLQFYASDMDTYRDEYDTALANWASLYVENIDSSVVRPETHILEMYYNLSYMKEVVKHIIPDAEQINSLVTIGLLEHTDEFEDLSVDARIEKLDLGLDRVKALIERATEDDLITEPIKPFDSSKIA